MYSRLRLNRARAYARGLLITFPGRLSGSAEVLPDMSYYISDTMSINSDPCAPIAVHGAVFALVLTEWGSISPERSELRSRRYAG